MIDKPGYIIISQDKIDLNNFEFTGEFKDFLPEVITWAIKRLREYQKNSGRVEELTIKRGEKSNTP